MYMHTNRIHSIFILWRYPNPYSMYLGWVKKRRICCFWRTGSAQFWAGHVFYAILPGVFCWANFIASSSRRPVGHPQMRFQHSGFRNCNLPRRGGVSSMIYLLNRLTLSLIVVLQKNASRVANRDLWSRCAFFSNSTNHGKSMYCKS